MAAGPLIGIIEDDNSLRAALVRLIRSIGHRCSDFTSAEAFLASGVASDCNCIISDIQMPGMSGLDLARRVRDERWPVPVILISGRQEPGLEERALASGALCFHGKPIDTSHLIRCLEAALKA